METIKSYTDLSQSSRLAEILPIESSDGYWDFQIDGYILIADKLGYYKNDSEIPCWSLAALLNVISKNAYFVNEAGMVELHSIKSFKWCVSMLNYEKIKDCYADNPVDACYKMIIKLHKLNLLLL